MRSNRRVDEGDTTVRPASRIQIATRRQHEVVVEPSQLVEHLEGKRSGERLAERRAAIRLESVTEAAVGVLVRAQRGHRRTGGRSPEQVREAQAIDETSVEQHELLRRVEPHIVDDLHRDQR